MTVYLAVTTLSFDISVLELFLPLSTGAEIVIAKSDEVSDGQKLSSLAGAAQYYCTAGHTGNLDTSSWKRMER